MQMKKILTAASTALTRGFIAAPAADAAAFVKVNSHTGHLIGFIRL